MHATRTHITASWLAGCCARRLRARRQAATRAVWPARSRGSWSASRHRCSLPNRSQNRQGTSPECSAGSPSPPPPPFSQSVALQLPRPCASLLRLSAAPSPLDDISPARLRDRKPNPTPSYLQIQQRPCQPKDSRGPSTPLSRLLARLLFRARSGRATADSGAKRQICSPLELGRARVIQLVLCGASCAPKSCVTCWTETADAGRLRSSSPYVKYSGRITRGSS